MQRASDDVDVERFLVDLRTKISDAGRSEREIFEELQVVRAREKELLDKMAKVQEDLQGLRAEADELTSRTQTSYISRLPDELLANVFQEAKKAYKGKKRTEVLLSHVSRRWRAVAIHTSPLWSNILISPSTITMAEAYITRSSSQGLDLRVDCTFKITEPHSTYPYHHPGYFQNHIIPFNGATGPHLNFPNLFTGPVPIINQSVDNQQRAQDRVVGAALSCINRWRRVTIYADQDAFSKFANACAPSLQHLGIKIDSFHHNSPPLLLLQGGIPALSSLEITDVSPTMLSIPLFRERLSSLVFDVAGDRYPGFCDLLLGLPSLSHLTISRPFVGLDEEIMRVITMPNLRFLTLTGLDHTADDIIVILKTISAPKFEEFFVDVKFDRVGKYMDLNSRTVSIQQDCHLCTSLRSLYVDLEIGDPPTVLWFIEALPKDIASITFPHDSMLFRAFIINAIPYTEDFQWPPLCLISEEDDDDSMWSQLEDYIPVIFSEKDMTSLAREINRRFDGQVLWPTLQTLVLKGPHSSFYSLLRLLQARKKAGAPISTLRFECHENEFSTDFQNTVKGGLGKHVDAIEFRYTS